MTDDGLDPIVERVRLAALVGDLNDAVLMETPDRKVALTNQAFCDMFLVPAPPQALVGGDCVEAARSMGPLLGDVDRFLERVDELIAEWRTATGERVHLTDGRLLERDFLPVTHADGTREIAWVYRDVTEWESLRAAAVESARQNAELLSAISHDVRTPVTGIVGLVELLQRQPLDPRTRQIVDSVRQSAASLTTMLDDFLDAARADAGLLEVRPESVRPDDILSAVTDMVGPLARAKGLLLVTGVHPDLPQWVDLDAGRVRQILLNVVSNAVKYTSAGVVAVTAVPAGDDIVFACEDTGPGLGDQPADEAFRAFVTGAVTASQAPRGAGLGLAIASKLAAVMGGTLGVSRTDERGSLFELSLPLVVSDRPSDPDGPLLGRQVVLRGPAIAVAAASLMVRRAGAQLVDTGADVAVVVAPRLPVDPIPGVERTVVLAAVEPFRVPDSQEGVLAAPVSEAELCAAVLGLPAEAAEGVDMPVLTTGIRVLLVEDDTTNRTLISRMVEVIGGEVTAVADGPSALRVLTTDTFDAVLMDIHLPGLDGVETAGLIRRRQDGGRSARRLAVVAMTGSSGWTDPQTMLTSGFDATLPKPMTIADLHACLSALPTVAGGDDDAPPAPSPAPESAAALDMAAVDALVLDIGDESLVRETMQTYLDELPQRIAAMTVGSDEQRSIREAAHSLKSASAMLGASQMAALCLDVESAAGQGVCTPEQVERVRAEAPRVIDAMRAYLG